MSRNVTVFLALFSLSQSVRGLTMKMQANGAHTANAMATISGLITVVALIEVLDWPKLEMI